MVKSRIQKKSNKQTSPNLNNAIAATTQHIKQWTQKELGVLQQQRIPVCIPVKHGYKIGLYNLKTYPNRTCDVRDHHDELIHTFCDKVSAVLYTIYTIKGKYWISADILRLDKEINKHYIDVIMMRRQMESARKRRDFDAVDIRQARLDLIEAKLKSAQEQMRSIHNDAKKNKVWL